MIVSTWTKHEVRALRENALRMSRKDFGALVGYTEAAVQKWEYRATADRPVRGQSAEDLDTVYANLKPAQRDRFWAKLAVAKPWGESARNGAVVSGEFSAPEEVEGDVKRRQFGVLVGTALVAASTGTGTSLSRIGLSDVQRLSDSVADYTNREQAVGGVTLVQEAVNELEIAQALLETADFDDHAGRAFMSAAGELATIAGWLAYDAALHPLARRCYAEAFSLASQAGDDELTVHVCLNAAHQSIYLSRTGGSNPHRALGFLSRARDLARGRPPGRVHALIATREAQAYGVLGDRSAFGKAIATAWRELDFALDHEPIGECPSWLQFVTAAEVRCHEARGIGDLGDLARSAELSADLVIDHTGARNAANYRAGWASALAQVGDINGAQTQGISVLTDLEKDISSTRTLRLLEPVRAAVEGWPDDEFRDRFDDLERKAVASA